MRLISEIRYKRNMEPYKIEKIEKLYDTYSKRLYFTSLRIIGNECEAEEVVQDTFLKYFNCPDKAKIQNIESWLVSICVRASIDVVRKRKREKEFINEYSDEELSKEKMFEPETQTICRDTKMGIVKKALMSLPDTLRIILSLHLIEGFDYEQIVNITGLNGNTIRSRYMRGREKLAIELKTMIKELNN